jgi:hypothetical protein
MSYARTLAILALLGSGGISAQTPPPAADEPSPAPQVPMSSFEAIQPAPPLTRPSDEPNLRLQLDENLTPPPPLSPNADSRDTPRPPPPREVADEETN